jgi:pimeloyl-ACP methyl ester carboxylesterase
MKHQTVSGKFGTTHYWIQGQGNQCIVFTHGATMDHGLFQFQMDYFAERYKVISWDVPQHGQSRPYKDFTLQKAGDELIGILDAEKINKAHLVGQSMGGYIIQYVARDYPKRVQSLIAVDSSPLQPSYYSTLDTWLLSVTPRVLGIYPYDGLIKTIAGSIAIEPEAQAYALETLKKYSKSEIVNIMTAVYEGVKGFGREAPLAVPILIVFGESDRTGKVQTYSRQWAEREKRPLQIISNASHNANMDNPKEFNKFLDEFLSDLYEN